MDFNRNRTLPKRAVATRTTEQALVRRTRELAPRIAAGTRRDTGETAMSTHVETGHKSASGDRPATRIVQGGASVPLNFRLDRDYMVRALGNGA